MRVVLRQSNLIFGALLTVILVVTGPFETHLSLGPMSLPIYWAVMVFGGKFVAVAIGLWIRQADVELSPLREIFLSAGAMVLIYAPPAYVWTWALVEPADGSLMAFHWFAVNVFIITVFVFAAREIILHHMLVERFAMAESGALHTGPMTGVQQVRLMARIAADDPGPIRRIEALDHFVSVVTEQATYNLRMRFCDAVAEMDGAPGVVTHRSHWVRRDQIRGTHKEGGRLFLLLACGGQIPVSRKYRPMVEEILRQDEPIGSGSYAQ